MLTQIFTLLNQAIQFLAEAFFKSTVMYSHLHKKFCLADEEHSKE